MLLLVHSVGQSQSWGQSWGQRKRKWSLSVDGRRGKEFASILNYCNKPNEDKRVTRVLHSEPEHCEAANH